MLSRGQDTDMLRYTLGNAYFQSAQFSKAVEHLRKACELNPAYSTAWKLLGRSLAELGQQNEALEAFDTALKVAAANGDKQVEKEVTVFKKRVQKQMLADQQNENPEPDNQREP